jgi:hypothetical protein
MKKETQDAANYLLNLVAELEPRAHIREALVASTRSALAVLMRAPDPDVEKTEDK